MTRAEDALPDGDIAVAHVAQTAYVGSGGRWLRTLAPRPSPPVVVRRGAVERALTSDGDVLLIEGVNEGRVVHQLSPLPARVDGGQVLRRVCAELERRALREMEGDVALQMNRAGLKDARGDDDATAARGVTRLDGFA